jgi:hypothetical protein
MKKGITITVVPIPLDLRCWSSVSPRESTASPFVAIVPSTGSSGEIGDTPSGQTRSTTYCQLLFEESLQLGLPHAKGINISSWIYPVC